MINKWVVYFLQIVLTNHLFNTCFIYFFIFPEIEIKHPKKLSTAKVTITCNCSNHNLHSPIRQGLLAWGRRALPWFCWRPLAEWGETRHKRFGYRCRLQKHHRELKQPTNKEIILSNREQNAFRIRLTAVKTIGETYGVLYFAMLFHFGWADWRKSWICSVLCSSYHCFQK